MELITIKIDYLIPDGATHYIGDICNSEDVVFLKCLQIGVVGDHWFRWDDEKKEWIFRSHYPSAWAKALKDITI